MPIKGFYWRTFFSYSIFLCPEIKSCGSIVSQLLRAIRLQTVCLYTMRSRFPKHTALVAGLDNLLAFLSPCKSLEDFNLQAEIIIFKKTWSFQRDSLSILSQGFKVSRAGISLTRQNKVRQGSPVVIYRAEWRKLSLGEGLSFIFLWFSCLWNVNVNNTNDVCTTAATRFSHQADLNHFIAGLQGICGSSGLHVL